MLVSCLVFFPLPVMFRPGCCAALKLYLIFFEKRRHGLSLPAQKWEVPHTNGLYYHQAITLPWVGHANRKARMKKQLNDYMFCYTGAYTGTQIVRG